LIRTRVCPTAEPTATPAAVVATKKWNKCEYNSFDCILIETYFEQTCQVGEVVLQRVEEVLGAALEHVVVVVVVV